MFVNKYNEFIAPGLYDDIFVLFVDAICYFEKNGVFGFDGLQNLGFGSEVNKFILTCFDLIIDGTADFYFDFIVNLEYQRVLSITCDEKINTELYLVKSLVYLLRARDTENIYYLVQHHCKADISQSLLGKMIDVFTEENIFTR